VNPILRKELRSLLRERRGWLVPVCYAAVLSAVVYLVLAPTVRGGASGTEVGQTLAGVVAVVQAIALLLVAPLVGAATIAGERERGTLTALLASPVSRRALGLGKAAAAILYTLVLMTGSLPVAAVSLFFGGPDAATLAGLYTTHAVVAVALVCVGMAISTLFQRTWAATLLAIGTTLGLVVLTLAVFAATGGMRAHGFEPPHTLVLAFNPGYGLALFFGGDEIGSRAAWLEHYAAMLVLAATGLGVAVSRLRRMRD
jgi:ABC-2 type transport system permease protein